MEAVSTPSPEMNVTLLDSVLLRQVMRQAATGVLLLATEPAFALRGSEEVVRAFAELGVRLYGIELVDYRNGYLTPIPQPDDNFADDVTLEESIAQATELCRRWRAAYQDDGFVVFNIDGSW